MIWIIVPILALSIPIVAIVTDHFEKRAKIKANFIKEQLELEKLKHENYLLETQKLKLELEKMQIETADKTKIL
ncbi:hypothetical protein [Bacillus sp. FJAT-49736]|uniref:hypothetical protein n=1 Tax=Bacillus sp. FJAT-49736 TaxID=2833582 RepID=UPI001BC8E835|nr:hypothetical protein [Bacillus sp. FJAT-49736]MBS4173056.1 hypothetical protein [Bacillus sp. FJAT-49736]